MRQVPTPRPPADHDLSVRWATSPAAGATISGSVSVAAERGGQRRRRRRAVPAGRREPRRRGHHRALLGQLGHRTASNGSHTLTALARDAAGNTSTSARHRRPCFNGHHGPDRDAHRPGRGATVGGTVSVAANAADNVGVVGVQFLLDGATLGAEDTTAPYSVSWNTATVSNGSHTLTARARDAAGNRPPRPPSPSPSSTDTTAPTVALTGPADGATVARRGERRRQRLGQRGRRRRAVPARRRHPRRRGHHRPYSVSWNTAAATTAATPSPPSPATPPATPPPPPPSPSPSPTTPRPRP